MKRTTMFLALTGVALALLGSASHAWWLETQLAGVRLGDPAMILLGMPGYGNPDGIIVTTARSAPAAAPGAGAAAPAEGAAEEGAPPEEGGGEAGAAPAPAAPAAGLGMARGYGNIPPAIGVQGGAMFYGGGIVGGEMLGGGGLPWGQFTDRARQAASAAQTAGMAGFLQNQAAAGGAGVPVTLPGGAEGLLTGPASGVGVFPDWVLSVWFDLRDDELEWFYIREAVAVGFVVNKRDGMITAISVAGDKCNFARTANWKPHRFVKLGDDFKQVHYRYGWPHDVETFVGGGQWTSPISNASITFGSTTNSFRRDVILWYHETRGDKQSNIAFTLHDMKVTRIHIWIPDPI